MFQGCGSGVRDATAALGPCPPSRRRSAALARPSPYKIRYGAGAVAPLADNVMSGFNRCSTAQGRAPPAASHLRDPHPLEQRGEGKTRLPTMSSSRRWAAGKDYVEILVHYTPVDGEFKNGLRPPSFAPGEAHPACSWARRDRFCLDFPSPAPIIPALWSR